MARRTLIAGTLLLVCAIAACGRMPRETGRFERTLNVNGPVRLDLSEGSGSVKIHVGPPGQVHVKGEFHIGENFFSMAPPAEEIEKSPPIEQQGNLIRIGKDRPGWKVSTDYDVTVPADTEVRASTGSGQLDVRGVRGPARLRAGSGDITAEQIGGDTQINSGSGSVHARAVNGVFRGETGSGNFRVEGVSGEVRVSTGSGSIVVVQPQGRVTGHTGSGDIEVRGVVADVLMRSGSGDVTISGDPAPRTYWDVETSSGRVALQVPGSASFIFQARSHSGRIETDLPLQVTERSKRELRGRVGSGDARISVVTSSGTIQIR